MLTAAEQRPDGTIVHVTGGRFATTLGNDVLIGHQCVIHGRRLEDESFIGIEGHGDGRLRGGAARHARMPAVCSRRGKVGEIGAALAGTTRTLRART